MGTRAKKLNVNELDGKLVFNVVNGGSYEITPDELSPDIIQKAILHGLKQTISDAASGTKAGMETDVAVRARIELLKEGSWTKGREGGVGSADLIRALFELMKEGNDPRTEAECAEVINGLDAEQKKEFGKKPAIAAKVALYRAERAQKAAANADAGSLADVFA